MANQFRIRFPKLGPIGELIIANVIVGSISWDAAFRMGESIMEAYDEGRLK